MKIFAVVVAFFGLQTVILLVAAHFYRKARKNWCWVAIFLPVVLIAMAWQLSGDEGFLGFAVVQLAFSLSYSVHLVGRDKP